MTVYPRPNTVEKRLSKEVWLLRRRRRSLQSYRGDPGPFRTLTQGVSLESDKMAAFRAGLPFKREKYGTTAGG